MTKDDFDKLGDVHKSYEHRTESALMPGLPIVARLDGRGFSKFTKGLQRPFDENFSKCMVEVASHLVKEFHCTVGYTQSDEITLCWVNKNLDSDMLFGGRVQKLVSILSASASVKLNKLLSTTLPEKEGWSPVYDCRIFQYPTLSLAAESFLWRETDATRNSVSMAASHYYSHKQLNKVSTFKKKQLLLDKNVDWNLYPNHFKRGTYLKPVLVQTTLTMDELSKIPKQYWPNEPVTRKKIMEVDIDLHSEVTNMVDALFAFSD